MEAEGTWEVEEELFARSVARARSRRALAFNLFSSWEKLAEDTKGEKRKVA